MPADAAISWQKALLLSIRAAAAPGPKTGIPAAAMASATPAASGASGPTTTRSAWKARAASVTAAGSVARTESSTRTPGHRGEGGTPRDREDLLDAGLTGEPPGEGVLAAPATDDEDPPRGRGGGHQASPPPAARVARAPSPSAPAASSDRSCITTVWVRSGPTETSRIGTPANASSAPM